ncbi:MAG: hypothetical protein K0S22_2553 [Oscillospiraceae bacterium]|jgi:hypothetical protein|nr:hypothetical protein [Oscillospiraceae bacterium]
MKKRAYKAANFNRPFLDVYFECVHPMLELWCSGNQCPRVHINIKNGGCPV